MIIAMAGNRAERRPKLGFPRFKKRGTCKDSFRLTGTLRCAGKTVTLPRLGVIAACEPTDELAPYGGKTGTAASQGTAAA